MFVSNILDRNAPEKSYVPPRLTNQQMNRLEYLIAQSKDASEICKKLVIWIIRQTKNLTEPVAVCMHRCDLGRDAILNGISEMNSQKGSTHLESVFIAAGTEMGIHTGHGRLENRIHDVIAGGYIVWCTFVYRSPKATILQSPRPDWLDANISLENIIQNTINGGESMYQS